MYKCEKGWKEMVLVNGRGEGASPPLFHNNIREIADMEIEAREDM